MKIFLIINIVITLVYILSSVYISKNHTGAHGGFGAADLVVLIMAYTKIQYIVYGVWLIYIALALTSGGI